jgi:hypothetical protein
MNTSNVQAIVEENSFENVRRLVRKTAGEIGQTKINQESLSNITAVMAQALNLPNNLRERIRPEISVLASVLGSHGDPYR